MRASTITGTNVDTVSANGGELKAEGLFVKEKCCVKSSMNVKARIFLIFLKFLKKVGEKFV
jgi:hypothetical protein